MITDQKYFIPYILATCVKVRINFFVGTGINMDPTLQYNGQSSEGGLREGFTKLIPNS